MTDLSDYKNLVDWALNAHYPTGPDDPAFVPLPDRKRQLIEEINQEFGLKVGEPRINDWLRGDKAIYKNVKFYLAQQLIEGEIEDSERAEQLANLIFQ